MGFKVSKITGIEGEYPQKIPGVKDAKISYAKLSMPRKSGKSAPVLELHFKQKPRILPKESF